MKREHLINTILSAVFPSGSIPLAHAQRVPRILGLVEELADEVGPAEPPAVSAKPATAPAKSRGPYKKVDWDTEPRLGVVSDSIIARDHGVAPSSVRQARETRGLLSPVMRGGKPRQVAQPAAAEAVPSATPATPAAAVRSATPPAVVSISERTAPGTSAERQAEKEAIEQYVRTKGVTKIKSRYVEPDSIPANPKGRGGLV
jgi:hypothetical protein